MSIVNGAENAQTVFGVVAIAAAMACCGVLAQRIEPSVQVTAGLSAAAQEKVDKAASSSLFGQFRSSMADFLWLKVDRYVHGGVELRGMTPQEIAQGNADKVGSAEGKAEGSREHHNETTLVPSARRDWRGIYGDLDREVQPYQDMSIHTHHDPKEALPLFRLMTLSNPHFIPGYTVGAAMIARNANGAEKDKAKLEKAIDQAINFLIEGSNNNPDSIEIAESLGEMYTARKRQFTVAVPYLEHAIALGKARDRSTFTEDEDEAFEYAYRWMVLNRRESGDQKTARAYATEGLHMYPNDVVCRDYLARQPLP